MREQGRKKGKKKIGRRKGKEFMDAVHEAYLRYLVEEIWADLEGGLKTGATKETAWITEFEERGPYKEIWQRAWKKYVPQPLESQTPWAIVMGIEEAVSAAAQEEEAERQRRGDRSFFEEEDYEAFVHDALHKLLTEEGGSLEDADE